MILKKSASKPLLALVLIVLATQAYSAEDPLCQPPRPQSPGSDHAENRRNFEQQFTTAEKRRLSAATAGAEWLETEDLLLRSQKEATDDNWSDALQLAYKACFQAETALQQAAYESQAWKGRVIE